MRRGALALKGDHNGAIPSEFAKRGRAAFFFDRDHRNRTYLARQYTEYPYHVTRPLYVVDSWPGFATVLLQSVSGGLFQGDRLSLEIELAELAVGALQAEGAVPLEAKREHILHLLEVNRANDQATVLYRAESYAGKTVLIAARDRSGDTPEQLAQKWAKWLEDRVESQLAPGNHRSMIYQHAADLADIIRTALQDHETQPGGSRT